MDLSSSCEIDNSSSIYDSLSNSNQSTECEKCMKLNMCCEKFEISSIIGRCLRCNHYEQDHCLESGSSSRPFPLLLYPKIKQKPKNKIKKEKHAKNKQKIKKKKENTIQSNKPDNILLKEITQLQDELESSRSLIKELLSNQTNKISSSDYYLLESQLTNTRNEILKDSNNIKNKQEQSLLNNNNNKQQDYKIDDDFSLKSRLYKFFIENNDNINNNILNESLKSEKSLSKNISRHTLITRGFINTHFKKLEGEDIKYNKINTFKLFKTLIYIQKDFHYIIQYIQDNCFYKYEKEYKEKEKEEDNLPLLSKYFINILLYSDKILQTLDSIAIDNHITMKEIINQKQFNDLTNNIHEFLNHIITYSSEFPNLQYNLDIIFSKYSSIVTLFSNISINNNNNMRFSDCILLPFRYSKNFVYFYSQLLELLTIKDIGFNMIVCLLSQCRNIEKRICDNVSKFQSISSNLRSQFSLFSHNKGLLYDPNRELIYQSNILLYQPCNESIQSPRSFLSSSFLKCILYIFSDSLIISFNNTSKSPLKIHIKTIISISNDINILTQGCESFDNISCKQIINSSFILSTISLNYLICTNGISHKYETAENILSTFRKYIQNNINYGSKEQRNLSFESLDVFYR